MSDAGASAPAGGRGDAPARDRCHGNDLIVLLGALAAQAGRVQDDYGALKRGLLGAVARDPFDAALVTVLGGALLFYIAERGRNPKVQSYWDALVFVSTCMSVGYADVFARTPAGKAIASAVMTIGPALSGAMLEGGEGGDRGGVPPAKLVEIQTAVLAKLDAILGELRKAPAP